MTTPLVRTIRLVASVALIAAVIFVYFRVMPANTTTTVALTLLLAILGIATQWGLTESIVASIAAALGFNYFFLPPVGTFTISDTQNWVAFGAFLVTAITASQRCHHREVWAVTSVAAWNGGSPKARSATAGGRAGG